jgi:hypothetical protein
MLDSSVLARAWLPGAALFVGLLACGGGEAGLGSNPIVNPPTRPSIVLQPQSLTVNSPSAATFQVTANGTLPLQYQWTKDERGITGATQSTLTISPTLASSAGSYRVIVGNSTGFSAVSDPAILVVDAPLPGPPIIITQPMSITVTAPDAATFSVLAVGTPAPSYQWLQGGISIPGATQTTLTISPTSLSDNGTTYQVRVSNGHLPDTLSVAATLTVTSQHTSAPTITQQPQSVTVVAPNAIVLTVVATGNPAPTYQWMKNGNNIEGATLSTLTISPSSIFDSGNYQVLVSNGIPPDALSSVAVVTVNIADVISTSE